jgi:hypothetical protein
MQAQCAGFTTFLSSALAIIEGELLPFDNVPQSKEAESGQVGIETIDPDVEDGEVRVARVIDEMSHVAVVGGVHSVGIILAVEIQVE